MTTRHLNRLFHEAADGAGIKKGVTLHTLRHYAESRIMPSCLWISGGSRRVEPALLGIILTRPKASSLPLGGLPDRQLGIEGKDPGEDDASCWRPGCYRPDDKLLGFLNSL